MLWINKYTATLCSNKKKDITIFHLLQGYLVIYFNYFHFLFTLAKFDIYHWDLTSSCITNFHTNLAYLGLAKIIAAQDGTRSLFFKDAS